MKYYHATHNAEDHNPTPPNAAVFSLLVLIILADLSMTVWSYEVPALWAAYALIGILSPMVGLRLALELREPARCDDGILIRISIISVLILLSVGSYLLHALNPAWIGFFAGIYSGAVLFKILKTVV